MKLPIYAPVQPRADLDPPHPRAGQAGCVIAHGETDATVTVRWDLALDGQRESAEAVANLRQLG